MVNCSVPGCQSGWTKTQLFLRYFLFPSDVQRSELWRAFMKRDDNVLPKRPRICEVHFDESQFEPTSPDGWRKLKSTAVPTLFPPNPSVDCQLETKRKLKKVTKGHLDTSLKLTGGEELHNSTSLTSTEHSGNMAAGKHRNDQQESETNTSSKKRVILDMNKEVETHVIRDSKVLQGLLCTIALNMQRISRQLQETSDRKRQLMQLVRGLTQKELLFKSQLKTESEKENVVKQQLREVEDMEKQKAAEEPCGKEGDTLNQQVHHQHTEKEDGNRVEQCFKGPDELIEKDSQQGVQIAPQNENDLIAKNILSDASATKQMKSILRPINHFVVSSRVEVQDVELVTVKLENDEDTNNSNDSNPGHLTNSTDLITESSGAAQSDCTTMLAESLSVKTYRVKCNNPVQSNKPIFILPRVETSSLSEPSLPPQLNYVCWICEERFWNAGALYRHERAHGNDFRCNVCDKVFSYRNGLKTHKLTHTDERPFGCTLCDRHFKTNGQRNHHFLSHTREKRYACSFCSETFFYSYQRAVHMAVHTGRYPFMCQDCGRGFSSRNSLTIHMRRHSGEKPYECDVCGKRFHQSSAVKAHKEMHDGEKQHVCSYCGKRLRKGSVWTHMKQHTEDSGLKTYYECAVCDKKLSSKQTLEMHTRMVHMGEAPYVCKICYMQFGKHKDLQLHRKEHN